MERYISVKQVEEAGSLGSAVNCLEGSALLWVPSGRKPLDGPKLESI